jgi:hypothetical protein
MPIDSARLERIRKYNASQRAAAGMEPKSTAPTSGLRNPQAVSRFQESMRRANPDIVGRSSNTTSTAIARRTPAELARLGTRDLATRASGEIATRGAGEIATRQGGEIARRAGGEMVKAGSNARPIGLTPPPAPNTLIRSRADVIPKGGELATRQTGEIARRVSPAGAAGAAGQGMGVFGPLAAAAAIAAADKATDYKRAKFTQSFGGPQFDMNPYARSNDNMKKGMKYGMKDTQGNPFSGHLTGFGGPVEDLLGYGVSLVKRGRNFDDAKKLITGTEKFRKLSEPVQRAVLSHYDFWRAGQSKGKNTARMVDDMTKPAFRQSTGMPRMVGSEDITGMRKPLRRALGMEK